MDAERFVEISDQRRSVLRRLRRYAEATRHLDAEGLSERLRQRLERGYNARLLEQARGGRDVCWLDDSNDPLVTIRIATYNRGQLVVERAVASALAQSYRNVEVLVIGDACDAATAAALEAVDDPRGRFINLPSRPLYPQEETDRWQVAGFEPMNVAIALAAGSWMAPCDDDDELTGDHVERLLRFAQQKRLEFVWSKTQIAVGDGAWAVLG